MWAGRAANEQAIVVKLKEMLEALRSQQSSVNNGRPAGNKFAERVKLGRENQALRAQVEALKAERKKFVQKLRRGKVVL